MPQTTKPDPVRTRDGQIIVSGERYFCDHPTDPSQKEVLVVEKIPCGTDAFGVETLIICRNDRMQCRHAPATHLLSDPDSVAKDLWLSLGAIPCDEDGNTEEPFLHFPVGSDPEEIWLWFEATFDLSVAEDLMGIKAP